MIEALLCHRRLPIAAYHSHGIGNPFRREKMLEVLSGFSVESRLCEAIEKRGRTRSKAGKKSEVCGVRECPEETGECRDTSPRVVIPYKLCSLFTDTA